MDATKAVMAPVQLDEVDAGHGPPGVVWSAPPSELNVNLVVLPPGASIAAHTNAEVDVLVVVVAGEGKLTTDGIIHGLVPTGAVVVPRGVKRSVVAGPSGIRYLSVHRARGALGVGRRSSPSPAG